MLSRILAAVDDSEGGKKAFDFAVALSKKFESSLLIAHVIEEHGTVGHSVVSELEQDSQRILQKYQAKARDSGLKSSHVNVIEGKGTDVAEKILEIAREENMDAIVVGGRGKYLSSDSFLLGSTSSKLVHYGGYTIIIVK
ncbi:MAG: universal stress protein [Nitrososphaeraceae archaeon]|jgi:nucleotide-binding universal stress UspA family protein